MSDFAQCSSCRYFDAASGHCGPLATSVQPDMSCGLYAPIQPVSPSVAGLVDRQVRCEHCDFFDGVETCKLFEALNIGSSRFRLNTKVDSHGCCNAQTVVGGAIGNDAFLYMESSVGAVAKVGAVSFEAALRKVQSNA